MGLKENTLLIPDRLSSEDKKESPEEALFNAAATLAEEGVRIGGPLPRHVYTGTYNGEEIEIRLEDKKDYPDREVSTLYITGAGFEGVELTDRGLRFFDLSSTVRESTRLPRYSVSGTVPEGALSILDNVQPNEAVMGELRKYYSLYPLKYVPPRRPAGIPHR